MYKQSKHMVLVKFVGASFIRVLKNDIMQTEQMHTLRTAVSKQHMIISLNLFLDIYMALCHVVTPQCFSH